MANDDVMIIAVCTTAGDVVSSVRFMMLFRSNDAVLDFDLLKVIEQSRDNPIFYVQYGHARGQSASDR